MQSHGNLPLGVIVHKVKLVEAVTAVMSLTPFDFRSLSTSVGIMGLKCFLRVIYGSHQM